MAILMLPSPEVVMVLAAAIFGGLNPGGGDAESGGSLPGGVAVARRARIQSCGLPSR